MEFDNIIRGNPQKTEREKEFERLAKNELEDYRRKKKAFYDNPIHWDNNKRRRYGLSVLRGTLNKNRPKKYRSFHLSVQLFYMMEDLIEERLVSVMWSNLDSFVDEKNVINNSDVNIFEVDK